MNKYVKAMYETYANMKSKPVKKQDLVLIINTKQDGNKHDKRRTNIKDYR